MQESSHSRAEEIELSRKEKSKSLLSGSESKYEDTVTDRNVDKAKETYDKVFFLASICLKFEQYEDAIRYVDEELNEEERDIFVSAYRYYIAYKRSKWRNVYSLEVNEKENKTKYILLMNEIRNTYEDQITKACEKLIFLINNNVQKNVISNEGRAFFLKVKADHYRYMAEISHGTNLYNHRQNALQFYNQAYTQSIYLNPLNLIRLGVALNYSVFFYEVLNNSVNSLAIAGQALNDALEELKTYNDEGLEDEKMKDSLATIQVMKNNVHSWYKEIEQEIERENFDPTTI